MTGPNFLSYVKKYFKRTDKDTEIYQATTDAVMDIKLRFPFADFQEEAYTIGITSSGEYTFALPSDYGHLLGDVTFIDETGGSKELHKLSKVMYDAKYPDREETSVDTGTPQDYCIYKKQIFIGPIPDSTSYKYQINYTTEAATTINGDSTTIPFTTYYRWILREKVLELLYEGLGHDQEAAKWRQLAERDIPRIMDNESMNQYATEGVNYSDV